MWSERETKENKETVTISVGLLKKNTPRELSAVLVLRGSLTGQSGLLELVPTSS